jgi:hypothetical protein
MTARRAPRVGGDPKVPREGELVSGRDVMMLEAIEEARRIDEEEAELLKEYRAEYSEKRGQEEGAGDA